MNFLPKIKLLRAGVFLTALCFCLSIASSFGMTSYTECDGSIVTPPYCDPSGCYDAYSTPPDPTWDCHVHNTVNFINNSRCTINIAQEGACQFTNPALDPISLSPGDQGSFAIQSAGIMTSGSEDGSAICAFSFITYYDGDPQTEGQFVLQITTQDFVIPLNTDGSTISDAGISGLGFTSITEGSHYENGDGTSETYPASISLNSESLCIKEPPD